MNKSKVYAKHINADISPKKLGIVMNLVRGKPLKEAKTILTFDPTKASKILLKVLKSAEANAVNNDKLNSENLFVSELWSGPNTPGKKPNFGARGRYSLKMSRKSNIYLGLSEAKS